VGRIAFVFSGQGDQYPGMGKSLADGFAASADVFAKCDSIRPGTSAQCFEGTESELAETKNTQPCMFACEMAAAEALRACGLTADMTAGFSLGEVAALTYAGAMELTQGFRLVCRRGELMQADAEKQDTSMAAVLKLTNEQVHDICLKYSQVYPVNFNCPGQVSVSGLADEMSAFCADVKAMGGRAMPLKVRGGFHSPFMQRAAAGFTALLMQERFNTPAIPVYSDADAQVYGGSIAHTLGRQISSPVRWEDVVRNMIADGADTFIEIGPGRTLAGLIGRIDKSVRTFAISAYEDLNKLVSEANA